jgi:hypothetical protein
VDTTVATTTLDALLAKLPAALQPVGQQYGPAVITMAASDIQAWLNLVFVGQYSDAYTLYLKALPVGSVDAEWDTRIAALKTLNDANAARIAMCNKIAEAVCAAMLPVVLALVGL